MLPKAHLCVTNNLTGHGNKIHGAYFAHMMGYVVRGKQLRMNLTHIRNSVF